MSLHLPAAAEADVGKTDAAPHEEVGETGERQEPGEEGATGGGLVYESKEPKDELDNDTPYGASFAVNVHEKFGTHIPRCKGLHGTCRAEGTRVCDTEHGYGDDSVEHRGKTADASHLNCKHEGGGLGVCAR